MTIVILLNLSQDEMSSDVVAALPPELTCFVGGGYLPGIDDSMESVIL